MKVLTTILLASALHSTFASAAEVTDIPQIGTHFPILTVEKNVNPENKMIVYTKVDSNCAFLVDQERTPLFDFYWLMNGDSYKPVHPLIKAEVQKRLSVHASDRPTVIFASLNDLKELNHDIPDAQLTIVGKSNGKTCDVDGFLTLGPSDGNATIRVNSIYSVTKGFFAPRVISITIKGTSVQSGQPVSRTYMGR